MDGIIRSLLSLSISGTVVALTLWLLCRLIGGKLGQAWRYYVWLLVLIRLMLPVATSSVNLVGTLIFKGEVILDETQHVRTGVIPNSSLAELNSKPDTVDIEETYVRLPTPAEALFTAWLVIACLLFIRKALKYAEFLRFVRQNGDIEDSSLLESYAAACSAIGIHKVPRVFVLPSISTPMTAGIFRPFIVVPENMDSERAYHIFLHELMHCKRHDALYKWIAELNVCLHWFNPIIYLVRKEIARGCELACDEAVLRRLGDSAVCDYGDTLLWQARLDGEKCVHTFSLPLNAAGNQLKERLEAIMKLKNKSTTRTFTACMLSALLMGGALLCGFARPVDSAKEPGVYVTDYISPSVTIAPSADKETEHANWLIYPTNENAHISSIYFENGYIVGLAWNVDITKYEVKEKINGITVCFAKACERYAKNKSALKAISSAVKSASAKSEKEEGWKYPLTSPVVYLISGPYTESATSLASKFYKQKNIAFFAAVIDKAPSSAFKEMAEQAYKDRRIDFFSITLDGLTESQKKGYYKRAAEEGRVDFFSLLTDEMSSAEAVKYAEIFYNNKRIDLFSIVLDALPQEKWEEYASRAAAEGRVDFFNMLADEMSSAKAAEYAETFYNNRRIDLFSIVLDVLPQEKWEEYASRAALDGRVDFFSILADEMSSVKAAEYAEIFYNNKRIDLFSIVLDILPQEKWEKYASRAALDGRVDFFSILVDEISETQVAKYAELFYKNNRIDMFWIIVDYLREDEIKLFYERAHKDKRIDFMFILTEY